MTSGLKIVSLIFCQIRDFKGAVCKNELVVKIGTAVKFKISEMVVSPAPPPPVHYTKLNVRWQDP